jgi:hypothetical protein
VECTLGRRNAVREPCRREPAAPSPQPASVDSRDVETYLQDHQDHRPSVIPTEEMKHLPRREPAALPTPQQAGFGSRDVETYLQDHQDHRPSVIPIEEMKLLPHRRGRDSSFRY